jgi:hypothetical protein
MPPRSDASPIEVAVILADGQTKIKWRAGPFDGSILATKTDGNPWYLTILDIREDRPQDFDGQFADRQQLLRAINAEVAIAHGRDVGIAMPDVWK